MVNDECDSSVGRLLVVNDECDSSVGRLLVVNDECDSSVGWSVEKFEDQSTSSASLKCRSWTTQYKKCHRDRPMQTFQVS